LRWTSTRAGGANGTVTNGGRPTTSFDIIIFAQDQARRLAIAPEP
jgi:hypothetical protein